MSKNNSCTECKHLQVIISQGGNYHCPKRDVYIDYAFYYDCEYFEQSNESLQEKEDRVW